jgi:hypothetical protein
MWFNGRIRKSQGAAKSDAQGIRKEVNIGRALAEILPQRTGKNDAERSQRRIES